MKRLFFTLCFLLIPSVAMAASSRVLPASYTEYTYDSAGGGEDYTAFATWEADTDIDVSSTGQVLTCSSGIHNDSVILAGATTDSNGFRVIRAASGARGTPTSGVRFELTASSQSCYPMRLNESYSSFCDIAVKAVSTVLGGQVFVFLVEVSGCSIIGCTAYNCTSTNGASAIAIGFYSSVSYGYLINCYAYGCTGSAAHSTGFYFPSWAGTTNTYIYNSTAVGNKNGVSYYADTGCTTIINAKNIILQGNTSNAFYNVGGAGTRTLNQTTNATSGVTFAADGYHLDSTDTGAIGNGTDLSADAVFAFDDDIDGETRNDWDIGCDEYVVSGPAAAPAGSQIIWFY